MGGRRPWVAGIAIAVAMGSPAAAQAARYAAPAGSGTECSETSPCLLPQAISGAAAGDSIVVEPGNHDVTTPMGNFSKRLDIAGRPGQPRPVITSTVDGVSYSLQLAPG